jgi:hypothetical protein
MLSAATEFWGPCAWKLMHSVAATYNPQLRTRHEVDMVKVQYASFYNGLQHVLPCHLCRAHYREFLDAHPVEDALLNARTLQKWVYDLHDDVNRRNGKKSPTFIEVLAMYNVFDAARPFTEASLADPHFGTKSDRQPAEKASGVAVGSAGDLKPVIAAVVLTSMFFVYCVPAMHGWVDKRRRLKVVQKVAV